MRKGGHIIRTKSAVTTLPDGAKTWTETEEIISNPHVRRTTQFTSKVIEETILGCFCCSCGENDWGGSISDPYCRNHGYAGTRPCELHNMPGTADDDGFMPESVQAIRAKENNAHTN